MYLNTGSDEEDQSSLEIYDDDSNPLLHLKVILGIKKTLAIFTI